MIPISILILVIIFVIIYVIGAGLTAYTFINSIQNRKIIPAIISFIVLIIYIAFYLALI
jgi:hypothetical protein